MKITLVVVLYKKTLMESKTINTLLNSSFGKAELKDSVQIIIYDNSPEKQSVDSEVFTGLDVRYIHDNRNMGLATAYNLALESSITHKSEWLLLLDHDTDITEDYANEILGLEKLDESVVAVVPKIISNDVMISPVYSETLRPLQTDRPDVGLQEIPVMAINSGSLIKVDFLKKIGGFNLQFPLDYLDHWLFHKVFDQGGKVWVLHSTLTHDLSVMDYNQISLPRHKSIIDSEVYFYKNFKTSMYKDYKVILAKRAIKHLLTVKNKKIALYSLKKLLSM
ncbi:glycosyltransferase [Robertmurraya korlensis]|uniref:glycosyltransferase n=1 Tax=Robertmurraya korlensis TaxID=519977 RepID=UPI0008259A9A|nr:glycosyltransferase [Robertmurraya korlensis]